MFEVIPVAKDGDSRKFRNWLGKVERGEEKYYDEKRLRRLAQLEEYEQLIRTAVMSINNKFVLIGEYFCVIEQNRLFSTLYSQHKGRYCNDVYEYAMERFGMKKTTVFNLVSVAKTFAENGYLLPKWKGFSYSQLVEMLPMTDDERKKVTPNMTVKQIRELKNSLALLQPIQTYEGNRKVIQIN